MGYQSTLMENNLPFHPEYMRSGNWHYEGGYQQCLKLLSLSDPPTALLPCTLTSRDSVRDI